MNVIDKQHRKATRIRRSKVTLRREISFTSIALVFFLTSCANDSKIDSDFLSIPYFGPKVPHVLPFKSKRIHLSSNQEGTSLAESEEANDVQVSGADQESKDTDQDLKQNLTVFVNNTCAINSCAENLRENDLLSCQLYHSNFRTKQDLQFYSVSVSRKLGELELGEWIEHDSCIIGVTSEQEYKSASYNDSLYSANQKNYLDTIKLEASQGFFTEDKIMQVKVAIVDSGVGLHEDLGGESDTPGVIGKEDLRSGISKQSSFCTDKTYTHDNPYNPHGTFIAGIIGGKSNNGKGVVGIAQNSRMLSLTVGDCRGRMTSAEIGNALLVANARGSEVVNLSLGGVTSDDLAIRYGILALLNSGAVIVVSAGNEYKDLKTETSYPASYADQYPGLITVAWGTQEGNLYQGNQLTVGSNYSSEHVKILAPGTSIASTMSPATFQGYATLGSGGYAQGSGSSFSAPMVTAAVALTIGYLKKQGIDYDERLIDYLITEKGINKNAALADYVKNGAVLNLEKLAEILDYLKTTGETPQSIEIKNKFVGYDNFRKMPFVTFDAEWDLDATHLNPRIGVFDTACGYSAPCLIQDFPLEANKGSKSFRLTLNDTLPVLAELGDPTMAVNMSIAVFYRRKKPPPNIGYYNNYGLDAVKKLNLRDFDKSNGNSKFLGGVTKLRTDMTNLYVKGWACLEDSNKAVEVKMLNEAGQVIPVHFGYFYPYMIGHGTPIDSYSFSHIGGPFLAEGMRIVFGEKNSHLSGYETSPLLISPCRTLTAAHGFELVIPFKEIKSKNLEGVKFSIEATRPNNSQIKMKLADSLGKTLFTIPEVNFTETVTNTLSVNRQSDSIEIAGKVCSPSPSPINIEISYSQWNVKCLLKQRQDFPDFDNQCKVSRNFLKPPQIFNAGLANDRNLYDYYYFKYSNEVGYTQYELNLSDDLLLKHRTKYPVRWPNTYFSTTLFDFSRVNSVLANNIRQALTDNTFLNISSGERVTNFVDKSEVVNLPGSNSTLLQEQFLADREGTSLQTNILSYYWDYYDVGEPYTPSAIAYVIDERNVVGEYLKRTFGVKKLIREVKKYETPLGIASQVLGHSKAKYSKIIGGTCGYEFDVSHQVSDLSKNNPGISAYIQALLVETESSLDNIPIDDLLANFKDVPVDIRIFQDGVMFFHGVSDYESNVTPVQTLGRGK